jgi:hypothetical protein
MYTHEDMFEKLLTDIPRLPTMNLSASYRSIIITALRTVVEIIEKVKGGMTAAAI